jgi:hypothetical protein
MLQLIDPIISSLSATDLPSLFSGNNLFHPPDIPQNVIISSAQDD